MLLLTIFGIIFMMISGLLLSLNTKFSKVIFTVVTWSSIMLGLLYVISVFTFMSNTYPDNIQELKFIKNILFSIRDIYYFLLPNKLHSIDGLTKAMIAFGYSSISLMIIMLYIGRREMRNKPIKTPFTVGLGVFLLILGSLFTILPLIL